MFSVIIWRYGIGASMVTLVPKPFSEVILIVPFISFILEFMFFRPIPDLALLTSKPEPLSEMIKQITSFFNLKLILTIWFLSVV